MKNVVVALAAVALCICAWAADNATVGASPTANQQSAIGSRQSAIDNGADAIAIPQMLSYQGKLTDTMGVPVPNGNYALTFRLYTQPTGGSALWTEAQTIMVNNGLFSALLGAVTPIPSVPDAGALYLGLQVAADPELLPRLRIGSVAYAYLTARAANADLLQGRDTAAFAAAGHNHDAAYVNEGQANSVTGAMLVDGTVLTADVGDTAVTMAKIARAGATTGQVVKWTGSAWAPGPDNTGGGSGVTNVYQDTGIICVPNPITSTGNVKLDLVYGDARYVNEAQAAGGGLTGTYPSPTIATNAVSSANIVDGSVTAADIRDTTIATAKLKDTAVTMAKIARTGATTGQVIKWTGSAWAPRNDSVGSGGSGTVRKVVQAAGVVCSPNPITDSGTVRFDSTWGDGRYVNTNGDSMTGSLAVTSELRVYQKARLGFACSNAGQYAFCAGTGNSASGNNSSVAGGSGCTAQGNWSHVGGGYSNTATGEDAVVAGGQLNLAGAIDATVCGGRADTAKMVYSGALSGYSNLASDTGAVVAGGYDNAATKRYSAVGGGLGNSASGFGATVGGGYADTVRAYVGGVFAGVSNLAGLYLEDTGATVCGGRNNAALSYGSFVGGGENNNATDLVTTVGGGNSNDATSTGATVCGGEFNNASGRDATVGGGWDNSASDQYATVCGGSDNVAMAIYTGVLGGSDNSAGDGTVDTAACVAGGRNNSAIARYTFIGGGYQNYINYYGSTIGGGYYNTVSALYSGVAGGYGDTVSGNYGFATGLHSKVSSGDTNSVALNGTTTSGDRQTRVYSLVQGFSAMGVDHPLDPQGKILNQYTMASSEMVLFYRGAATIGSDGRASVSLPNYFDALCRNPMVQLTGVGTSDVYVAGEVTGSTFSIGGKPGTKVYWTVTAERKDPVAEQARKDMPVEQAKADGLQGRSVNGLW